MQQPACPSCGSHHIQSYPVIYDSGTSQVVVRHYGSQPGTSLATSQSDLAQHCAPPRPPSPLGFVAAYAFSGWAFYDTFFVSKPIPWKQVPIAAGALLVGWILWRAWRGQSRQYMQDKQRWATSWFCHGCGQSHLAN